MLHRIIPVARRVLGENHSLALTIRWNYADTLLYNAEATLNDLDEAVTTLEELEPTARRVLGSAHPLTAGIERSLKLAREVLHSSEGTA